MREQQGPNDDLLVAQLETAFAAVGELVSNVRAEQWAAPTPCTDWTVQRLVGHLIGMNRVFVAMLTDSGQERGRGVGPGAGRDIADPVGEFEESAADLLAAFDRPGILEREFHSPMGMATGAERLQIRLYDLLAHGWDLAEATGQRFEVPDHIVERSLDFVRGQLQEQTRPGRFDPAGPIADDAPAIERLVAFLGRAVPTGR